MKVIDNSIEFTKVDCFELILACTLLFESTEQMLINCDDVNRVALQRTTDTMKSSIEAFRQYQRGLK